ncbi:MAG: glycerol-3-phosphate 1-O-acyltransferase PlsY [Aquificota bacterium]|nr:glycerol-3-phosphate 1-O-acyltransferase PlsY [Aquificota bacterium]
MDWFFLTLFGYLLGSVLFGEIIAKAKGVNIREIGSGNVGATNVGRALGKRYALLVFLLDAGKGFLPAYLGFRVMDTGSTGMVLVGLAPVVGHMFPLFSRFRGGKGVATAFGVLTALSPVVAVLAFLVWGLVLLVTRYVSLASIISSFSSPFLLAVFGYQPPVLILALLVALLIVIRHRPNIDRLLRGEEPRV